MIELTRAIVPDSERDTIRDSIVQKWMAKEPDVRAIYEKAGVTNRQELIALVDEQLADTMTDTVYLAKADDGTEYQIAVRPVGEDVVHLSVKRKDREACRDWRHLQEIKNALVGDECEGVELFPAESRLVDTANQTHLWCYAEPDDKIPLGWDGGRMSTDVEIGKSKQRSRVSLRVEDGDIPIIDGPTSDRSYGKK